ncbi:FUSC family protein [Burkholderia sp. BCC1977]|uniref:FUSC family protein n=1 Tax=Burkholderia sp. BCC1977 TaxID=2817440 RepID=UPI002ABE2D2E|nr:FUSC family protein [Burkholderia sp. BCC1977]
MTCRGKRAAWRAARSAAASVAGALDARALARATLVLLPLVLLARATGRPEWLIASVITIAMLVGVDRVALAPLGSVAHGLLVCAGFVVLMAALACPPAFVAATAALGAASIAITAWGRTLRTLGSYTFIPVLYLACESAEGVARGALVPRAFAILPFLLAGALPVIALAAVDLARATDTGAGADRRARRATWVRRTDYGERAWPIELMLTVAIAVGGAAVLVEWRHIDHGQWMIWSAASVVTGSAASARAKFVDRVLGASAGVPIGVFIGLQVPDDPATRAWVVFATLLTLVAIRPYRLAFAMRCACAATALVVAGHTWTFAGERLANVALGSAIGLACALAAPAIARRVARRAGAAPAVTPARNAREETR